MRNYNYYMIAAISIVLGIVLSAHFQEGHFYTFFSLGMCMVLVGIYNKVSKEKLFHYWRFRNFFVFWVLMIVGSVVIDRIGLSFGYWTYPHFDSFFDEILKYVFEWVLAMSYISLAFVIGMIVLRKDYFGRRVSFVLSLVIFGTLIGLLTESLNLFTYSWKILAMPISNYKVGEFFVVFQTIGYWLMALIPVAAYKIAEENNG